MLDESLPGGYHGELVAEDEEALVWRVVEPPPAWYGHSCHDKVGDALFLVVLRPEALPPHPNLETHFEEASAHARWLKTRVRRAMRLVPAVDAGFPEWARVRNDDAVVVVKNLWADPPWGACVLSTYRRRIAAGTAAGRHPDEFTKAVRHRFLAAAGGRCRRCGAADCLEVDHIVPIGLGGTNAPENGLVLCRDCHLAKTRAERVFGLNRDEHRERGLTKREARNRTFTPDEFLAALKRRTGWTVDGPADGDRAGGVAAGPRPAPRGSGSGAS